VGSVLEGVVDPVEESVEERQRRENGDGEKTAVAVRTFGKVGTGKVAHEDKDLELVKAAERTEIVLV
jgi:hypothetical protein